MATQATSNAASPSGLFHTPDAKWRLGINGKNLTNKGYLTNGYNIPSLGILTGSYGAPRTVLATVEYRFF